MTGGEHTKGPWSVRKRFDADGELLDCFVTAPDVNGYAYDAEILGEDEYHDQSGGIARKLADCELIAAAPDTAARLREVEEALAQSQSELEQAKTDIHLLKASENGYIDQLALSEKRATAAEAQRDGLVMDMKKIREAIEPKCEGTLGAIRKCADSAIANAHTPEDERR